MSVVPGWTSVGLENGRTMGLDQLDVVVPTLGQKESLGTTLTALGRQDNVGKIIVVASGDGANPAILAKADSSSRVELIRSKDLLPAGAARNVGVRATTAKYVGFCDDDDVWTAGFARAVTAEAAKHQVAVGTLHLMGADQRCISVAPVGDKIRRKDLHVWNPGLTGSNVIISRAHFDEVGGWPDVLRSHNDVGFLIRLLKGREIPVVRDATVLLDLTSSLRIGKVLRRSASCVDGLAEECLLNDGPRALRREARTQSARFRGELSRHLLSHPTDIPAAVRLGRYAAVRRIPAGLRGRGCGCDHSAEFISATT